MTSRLFAITLAATAMAATGQPVRAQADEPAEAAAIQDCSAHRFETVLQLVVDGLPKQSRLKLCGTKGQTDAEWVATLEDAVAKLRSNDEMPEDMRTQAIAAIGTEVTRLRSVMAGVAPALPVPDLKPRKAPDRSLSSDYSSLPPIPSPSTVAPLPAPTVELTPPLPAQGTSAAASPPARAQSSRSAAKSLLSAPNLAFHCYNQGDLGGPAPCSEFERDTQVTVRAKGELGSPVSLHFERNGADRANIGIGPLKKGRSTRFVLPRGVCEGVGDGSLTIVVWDGTSPIGRDGPYSLRCS